MMASRCQKSHLVSRNVTHQPLHEKVPGVHVPPDPSSSLSSQPALANGSYSLGFSPLVTGLNKNTMETGGQSHRSL